MKVRKSLIYPKDYSRGRLTQLMRFLGSPDPAGVGKAIHVLARGGWFEEVRLKARVPTAYQVGKKVQPHTYKLSRDGNGPHHHNLWVKYALGLNGPGGETIKSADAIAHQAKDILMAEAWKAFDVSHPLQGKGDLFLRSLRMGVQNAVFDPRQMEFGHYVRRSTLRRTLRMLEARADLDGVAAIVILLREAYEAGALGKAFIIGESLHGALLMAALGSPLVCVREEFYEFFIQKIFPMASNDEIAFDLDRRVLCEQARLLHTMMLILEDAGKIGFAHRGATGELCKILDGNFGEDLHYGLKPRWKLVKPAHASTDEARIRVVNRYILWDWGLQVLREGRVEQHIPREVLERLV
jgi:hypothetical protein